MQKARLGISRCLMGDKVRYDGSHKLDPFLTQTLGAYVEYVPVCPEVECGLPVPRESMHLEGDPARPRLMTSRTGRDLTDRMVAWAQKRVNELEKEELHGFVFKSNSPSSGMERVRVYDAAGGMVHKNGVGLFANAFMNRFPLLPVEEEGRLHDPDLRENFIERVFALRRWRDTVGKGRTVGNLVEFHARHKLLIMAHSPKLTGALGRIVAHARETEPADVFDRYGELLMTALKLKATVKKHTNVLQHMMGYFKKDIGVDEKQELLEVIGAYHDELIPLIVPVTLINHYVRKYNKEYLGQQTYLNPHPLELRLRNHV